MLVDKNAFKYETPYNGMFDVTQCCTNGTVTLECGTVKNGYNIHQINPYTTDTNVEYIKC